MKTAISITALLLAAILFVSVTYVPEDSVAIDSKGGASRVMLPGFHPHAPFAKPQAIYPVSLPSIEGSVEIALSDGGAYRLGYELSGRIDPNQAVAFHKVAAEHGVEGVLKAAGDRALVEEGALRPPADLATGALEMAAAKRAGMFLASIGGAEVSLRLRPLAPAELLRLAQSLARQRLAGLLKEPATALLLSDTGWEAHTIMGLVLESERDLHGAEKRYLDALSISPAALPPMAQLVAIYDAVGEHAKLDRVLEAAIEADPASLQHLNWLAVSLMKQSKLPQAEKMLQRALSVDGSNLLLLNNLAGMLVKQNRLEEAVASLRKAQATAPSDRQTLYNLGVALSAQGKYSEALQPLLDAEKAGPPGLPLLRALALAFRETGGKTRAAEYERRARAAADSTPTSS